MKLKTNNEKYFYNKLTIIDENLSLIYKYIEKNYAKDEISAFG